MSTTSLIAFRDGRAWGPVLELSNAFRGAYSVWTRLYDRYCRPPGDQGLLDADKTWALVDDPRLDEHERAVLRWTFDRHLVLRRDFCRLADDMQIFARRFGALHFHLPEFSKFIRGCDEEALGLQGTSVSADLWFDYDPDTGESLPLRMGDPRIVDIYGSDLSDPYWTPAVTAAMVRRIEEANQNQRYSRAENGRVCIWSDDGVIRVYDTKDWTLIESLPIPDVEDPTNYDSRRAAARRVIDNYGFGYA